MASAFSHIAIPIALNMALGRKLVSWRLLFLAMSLTVAPDLDSIAFKFGIPYESPWGQRGFTHSILFAILIALAMMRFAEFFKSSRKAVFFVSFVSLKKGALGPLRFNCFCNWPPKAGQLPVFLHCFWKGNRVPFIGKPLLVRESRCSVGLRCNRLVVLPSFR